MNDARAPRYFPTTGPVLSACVLALFAGLANAGSPSGPEIDTRVSIVAEPTGSQPVLRGQFCPLNESTHALGFNFEPTGQLQNAFAQAGFVEGETAAASYTLRAEAFPIEIIFSEIVFVQADGTVVPTTTQYTAFIWNGTPDTGVIAEVGMSNNEGTELPPLVMQTDEQATAVRFQSDEQIIIDQPGGSTAPTHTFSVGFRIDEHNDQDDGPLNCSPIGGNLPNPQRNAFPGTTTGPVTNPTQNWLQIRSGFLCCPGSDGQWFRFSDLVSGCRPSGDWLIRVQYESLNCDTGACCDGTVCTVTTAAECAVENEWFAGQTCNPLPCNDPPRACCFADTQGCVNLTSIQCANLGGVIQPQGSDCATYECFPTGSCCLPDGTCVEGITEIQCGAQGGLFNGANTTCAQVTCTPGLGACCTIVGCINLSQSDCAQIPDSSFQGAGLTCAQNASCPGACCLPDDSCVKLGEADCLAQSGTFEGLGTVCTTSCGNTGPDGACCVGSVCTITSELDCTGTWTAFVECGPGACEAPAQGSCCVGAVCLVTDAGSCDGEWTEGGVCTEPDTTCCTADFNKDGSTSVGDVLDYLAAWAADEPVSDTNTDGTVEVGDILDYLSDWADGCDGQLGACCVGPGCTVTTQDQCAGDWAEGMTCDTIQCAVSPLGSCCAAGTCTISTEGECAGVWAEAGVCELPQTTCCRGDFNRDGVFAPGDILDFLSAWSSRTDAADFNTDTLFSVGDILDFLNAWANEC